jgi:hypothetical protein
MQMILEIHLFGKLKDLFAVKISQNIKSVLRHFLSLSLSDFLPNVFPILIKGP